MKKDRLQKQFLEELSMVPIVSMVCAKLGLSRQSYYRWKNEDYEFAQKVEVCLKQGNENIGDLARCKLLEAMKRGEKWSVMYWLNNRDLEFMRPRPEEFWKYFRDKDRLDKIEVEIIQRKLTEEEINEMNELRRREEGIDSNTIKKEEGQNS